MPPAHFRNGRTGPGVGSLAARLDSAASVLTERIGVTRMIPPKGRSRCCVVPSLLMAARTRQHLREFSPFAANAHRALGRLATTGRDKEGRAAPAGASPNRHLCWSGDTGRRSGSSLRTHSTRVAAGLQPGFPSFEMRDAVRPRLRARRSDGLTGTPVAATPATSISQIT